jgi:hypothetical protein
MIQPYDISFRVRREEITYNEVALLDFPVNFAPRANTYAGLHYSSLTSMNQRSQAYKYHLQVFQNCTLL